MNIYILRALKDNFVYALVEGRECAVIDPGEAAPVQAFLKTHDLQLTRILCTHHHHDHIGGISALLEAGPCEVYCSDFDLNRIPHATRAVSEADQLQLFGEPLQVLAVPGHTHGQIAYFLPRSHALFPGDTLFSCGCGRLFEGTAEDMFVSMCKLRTLPAETKIYFGHEYTLRNIEFLISHMPSEALQTYKLRCERLVKEGKDTSPADMSTELKLNPFLTAATPQDFRHWRELRNVW